jgi:NADPH:quinone reductase-like Zn-dependent oxidoreductase
MKAVRLQNFGDVDQFKFETIPDPVPATGEVLIRVAGSGFNPVELYLRQGYLTQMFPTPLPAILGVDVSGTVEAIGPGVTGFTIGDRVAGQLPIDGLGSNAELTTAPANVLAKVPVGLDLAAAAAIPLSASTGYQAVTRVVKPALGQRIFVTGPLGAAGRAAIFAIRRAGGTPVAAIRAGQEAAVASLGVETFTLGSPPPQKFDGAVDTKGGEIAGSLFGLVKDGGTIGAIAGLPENAPSDGKVNAVGVYGVADAADLTVLLEAAAKGDLNIPVGKRLPLAEIGEGHRLYASGGAKGKIVFVP